MRSPVDFDPENPGSGRPANPNPSAGARSFLQTHWKGLAVVGGFILIALIASFA